MTQIVCVVVVALIPAVVFRKLLVTFVSVTSTHSRIHMVSRTKSFRTPSSVAMRTMSHGVNWSCLFMMSIGATSE